MLAIASRLFLRLLLEEVHAITTKMTHKAPDVRAAASSLFFPDAVVRAEVSGNAYLPQTPTSAILNMGSAAVGMILDGKYTWEHFTYAQPSLEQVGHAAHVLALAHGHYGIPVVTGEDYGTKDGVKVIPSSRLGDIVRYSRDIIIRTSAQFAVDLRPGFGQLRNEGPMFPLFHVPDLRDKKIALLDAFCKPRPDGSLPPEAIALGRFWTTAARSIQPSNQEARAGSACIRDGFAALYCDLALDVETEEALRDEIFCAGDVFWDVIETALSDCRRDIQATLNLTVPETAIDNFMNNTVHSVETQRGAAIL